MVNHTNRGKTNYITSAAIIPKPTSLHPFQAVVHTKKATPPRKQRNCLTLSSQTATGPISLILKVCKIKENKFQYISTDGDKDGIFYMCHCISENKYIRI